MSINDKNHSLWFMFLWTGTMKTLLFGVSLHHEVDNIQTYFKKNTILKCSWARNLNITANLQLFGIHFLVTFIIGWFWITREVTSCDFFKFSIIVWLKSTLGTSKRYSFVFNDSDYKSVIFVPLQFTVYSTLMAIYSNFEYTSNGNSNNSMHETDNH